MRGEELEGNGAVQRRVLGLVNDTHAALADFLGDLVVGHGLADYNNSSLRYQN